MSEQRLTDAALAELDDIAHLRRIDESKPLSYALQTRDKAAVRFFVNLTTELRERRALSLSPADREALALLRDALSRCTWFEGIEWPTIKAALAILDRLAKEQP